jgi:hypothetical protein
VALLCRRLYGHYLAPTSQHLEDRIAEIRAGKFDADMDKLKKMGQGELRRLYDQREIEPA